MKLKTEHFSKFIAWSAKLAGKPISFIVAGTVVLIWTLTGIIWGFTDSWLLLINTIATINASLMVFIIQNTQYRESKALHLKIDELLHATQEAENELIAIEEKTEEEIEELKKKVIRKRKLKK